MAGRPLPRDHRRARDCRTRPPSDRTTPCRSTFAHRKDLRQLRLRSRADDLKGAVMALAAGDSWLGKGANLLLFGPPGGGKSHLAAAIGLALIENGWRVLFTRPPISCRSSS
nr:ATP-binding protein [Bradyrhizobium guangxiense]